MAAKTNLVKDYIRIAANNVQQERLRNCTYGQLIDEFYKLSQRIDKELDNKCFSKKK